MDSQISNRGNDADESDPGLLSFGTSISINDDLRRCIGNQIQDIDAICTKMKEDIGVENKISDELLKSRKHADKELLGLKQGSADALNVINRNKTILDGLETTLTSEISPVQNPQDALHGTKENESLPIQSIREGLNSRANEVSELQSLLRERLYSMRDIGIRRTDLRREHDLLLKQNEDLEITLATGIENVENAQRLLDSEMLRLDKLKSSLQMTSQNVETMKEKIRRQDEENTLRKADQMKEMSKAKKYLLELQEKVKHLEEETKVEEAESLRLEKFSAARREAIQEANRIIAEKEVKKSLREEARAERNVLFKEQTDVNAEISIVMDMINAEQIAFTELENTKVSIEVQKENNDKVEAEKIIPGKAELEELKAEESKLDLYFETNAREVQLYRDDQNKKVEEKKKDISELSMLLQNVGKEIEAKRQLLDESRQKADDECNAFEELISGINLRTEKQKEENDMLEMQKQDLMTERKTRKEQEEHELQELIRKLEVLRRGQRLLQKTSKKERSILKAAEVTDSDLE